MEMYLIPFLTLINQNDVQRYCSAKYSSLTYRLCTELFQQIQKSKLQKLESSPRMHQNIWSDFNDFLLQQMSIFLRGFIRKNRN